MYVCVHKSIFGEGKGEITLLLISNSDYLRKKRMIIYLSFAF
jgi:hypothetical protein